MPTYTYDCKKCNTTTEIVKSIKLAERKEKCCKCRSLMIRCYQQPQVIRDTYREDHVMSAYPSVNGDRWKPDKVSGRTEKKRWLEKLNKAHGWNLVMD